jgi:hypothetical protein
MKLTLTVAVLMLLPVNSQPAFVWKDVGDGRLALTERGNPVLVYNYGPQLKEGAPENRRRCCYIYPLYTPSGVSILDDFPKDHWHHRGLFWAWPVVETEGKTYDEWMNMTVKDHTTKPPVTKGGRLQVQNTWQIDGRDIVREGVVLTALPSQGDAREVTVELTLEALANPVTLKGSRETGKSYGGFSARFAPREDTILRADGETLSKDEDLTTRHWAELEGTYGGKKAVLRITPDASDPGVPYQWCLRKYGFVGASFPGRTPTEDGFTLQPKKPVKLTFQVRIVDKVN